MVRLARPMDASTFPAYVFCLVACLPQWRSVFLWDLSVKQRRTLSRQDGRQELLFPHHPSQFSTTQKGAHRPLGCVLSRPSSFFLASFSPSPRRSQYLFIRVFYIRSCVMWQLFSCVFGLGWRGVAWRGAGEALAHERDEGVGGAHHDGAHQQRLVCHLPPEAGADRQQQRGPLH